MDWLVCPGCSHYLVERKKEEGGNWQCGGCGAIFKDAPVLFCVSGGAIEGKQGAKMGDIAKLAYNTIEQPDTEVRRKEVQILAQNVRRREG